MAVIPEVADFLRRAAARGGRPIDELTVAEARAQAASCAALIGSGPALPRVRDDTIDGPAGAVAIRIYTPARAAGAIVWLHGGGWVLGGLDSHDAMCRLLAQAARTEVIAVDYRLAPEHRFPAALEDAWSVMRAVAGAARGPVAVGGDSAGGNLAAVCARRARDASLELAAQVLVYPVCDHDFGTASYVAHGDEGTLLGRREMEWFWDHYVPDPARRNDPDASPLRAADLAGLAPAIVVLAGLDPLLSEGRAYALRLRAAGVAVRERCDSEMLHAYFEYVNVLPTGNIAVAWAGAELRAACEAAAQGAFPDDRH